MTQSSSPSPSPDRLRSATETAARRAALEARTPEPSLAARLGQIGILGWAIVSPTLIGLIAGRWLDHLAGTRVFFTAPLIMIGAAIGFWSAWKWMHRTAPDDREPTDDRERPDNRERNA